MIYTEIQQQQLVALRDAEGASCVIRRGDEIRIFRERGVTDLFRLLDEEPDFLRGAFVADKVVGKGAAALMILGGVAGLRTEVISTAARRLLGEAHLPCSYAVETPQIINRKGTGTCPVESLCRDCRTAAECLPLIRNFLTENQKTL